jgi:hypothetical protein
MAGTAGPLVLRAGAVAIEWLVLLVLYEKNVFLRV